MKRLVLICLTVGGCGDDIKGKPDASMPIDALIDAPIQMGVVNVSALNHYLTEAGDVTGPAMGFQIIDSADKVITPGMGPNGALQFTNVAAGPYFLCDVSFVTRANCVQANSSVLDVGRYLAGRPNVMKGATGTVLNLTTTGLTASTGVNEFLDIRALNTNYIQYPAPPAAGTTLVQSLNFKDLGLLQAADVMRATQFVTKTSGSETYVAAVRAGSTTGVMMTDGATTNATIDASMALAQSTTRTFNLRRTQFANLAGSPGPGFTYLQVDINGYSEARPYDYQPWVFWYTGAGNETMDLPLTIVHGDPTPASYVDTFEAAFWFQKTVSAPGASGTVVQTFAATYRPSAELTGDITPKLSRVTGLKVNGMDAYVAQTNTTQRPTISWSPPTVGTATHYQLYVYRVINQGGASVITIDGTFITTETSMKIPATFIKPAETYMIGVRAYMVPGYDLTKPFARPTHYDLADTISEVLTP